MKRSNGSDIIRVKVDLEKEQIIFGDEGRIMPVNNNYMLLLAAFVLRGFRVVVKGVK